MVRSAPDWYILFKQLLGASYPYDSGDTKVNKSQSIYNLGEETDKKTDKNNTLARRRPKWDSIQT